MITGRRHNSLTYRLELLYIRLRDRLRPPDPILIDAGVRPGMTVLDFGCGPGGFSLAAAKLVGPQGKVYAVDVQPLALETVRRTSVRRGMDNIQVIHGENAELVPPGTVDLAILYDVLHAIGDEEAGQRVMFSVHRALKPEGKLSVRDHHLKEVELSHLVTGTGLFRYSGRSAQSPQFIKIPPE